MLTTGTVLATTATAQPPLPKHAVDTVMAANLMTLAQKSNSDWQTQLGAHHTSVTCSMFLVVTFMEISDESRLFSQLAEASHYTVNPIDEESTNKIIRRDVNEFRGNEKTMIGMLDVASHECGSSTADLEVVATGKTNLATLSGFVSELDQKIA